MTLVVVIRPAEAAEIPGCSTSSQACVVVKVVSGTAQQENLHYFTSSQVSGDSADVVDVTYDVPGTGGVHVTRGTSVESLITQSGLEPSQIAFVEVDTDDGYGRHPLLGSEPQAVGGDGSAPVFYADSGAEDRMRYVRANRGGDDDQRQSGPNQGLFLSDQDGALEVVVHLTGVVLKPDVVATPVDGSNGRSYNLTCSDCSGSVQTTWYFPDGTTSSQVSPTYTFPSGSTAGSYLIALAAEDESNGSFGWGQEEVRIGAAPAPTPSASQTASGGNGEGHHGSNHGGPGHSANPHPSTGPGGSATASPAATASAGPSGPPTIAPVSPTSLPSSSYSVAATDGPFTAPARPTPAPTPTPTPLPTPSVLDGRTVTGVLLAAPAEAAPSGGADVSDVPASSSAAAPALEPDFRIDPLIWLGGGGALLLAAGASSESERVRWVVRRGLRRWARIGA